MRRHVRAMVLASAVASTSLLGVPDARAQGAWDLELPRSAAGLVVGASQFDLSGTGTTSIFALRGETELRHWLVVEGALGTFRPAEDFGVRDRHFVPEVQLQIQNVWKRARPYLGAGGGWLIRSGNRPNYGTASGAAGIRFSIPSTRFDARAELRVRGIGRTFVGSAAEWTMGAAYRF